jgi:hypothetical protein
VVVAAILSEDEGHALDKAEAFHRRYLGRGKLIDNAIDNGGHFQGGEIREEQLRHGPPETANHNADPACRVSIVMGRVISIRREYPPHCTGGALAKTDSQSLDKIRHCSR